MADVDGLKVAKDYKVDVPFANQGDFHLKGANNLERCFFIPQSRLLAPFT